jgi:2-methylcitrate dehydratase PrpD
MDVAAFRAYGPNLTDKSGDRDVSALVETLSSYAAAEQTRPLSDEVRHHAKRALIDWFAALLPGAVLPPATMLLAALDDEIGQGRALIYGTERRAPLRTAAQINATASHTIEFDDIFRDALYHPGSPTIAAALAAAQARGADGEMLLRSIITGYEVSTRIGVAVQPAHYRFWHTTGTIGTFGAACAVATVLRLDPNRIGHALVTAGTLAAGLQQAYRSDAMSKPLHAGHAADAGALAALAAGAGVTGALDLLDGEIGFGNAMSDGANWTKAIDELGNRYNITSMTFKNHSCCGHSFAPIDAALQLAADHALTPDQIRRVTVGTYRVALEITDRHSVSSPYEARFSTPFTVATALVHGSVRLSAFTEDRLRDAQVQSLMRRVEMIVDPACDEAFPRRSAVVEIETTDGHKLRHFQPTRKCDPDFPLSDAELTDKFLELCIPIIGRSASEHLIHTLWRVDELPAAAIATLGAGMGTSEKPARSA